MRELPSGLRSYQPGISWRWIIALTVVLPMLFWNSRMVLSYISKRHLIIGAGNRCGLAQKVSDNTVAATRAIFYKQMKTLIP